MPNQEPAANTPPAKVVAKQAAPAAAKEYFYLVNKTYRIPRGAGAYMLREGKVISSVGYDIQGLLDLGVELTEVEPGTKSEVRASAA